MPIQGQMKKSKVKFEMLLMVVIGVFSNNFFGTSRFKFIVQMHTSENFQAKYHGSTELK